MFGGAVFLQHLHFKAAQGKFGVQCVIFITHVDANGTGHTASAVVLKFLCQLCWGEFFHQTLPVITVSKEVHVF